MANESQTDIWSEKEKEGLKFLEMDFNQCFQQMRHYDSQIIDLLKYLFTIYSIIISSSIALYNIGVSIKIDLSTISVAIVGLGLIIGFVFLGTIIRNRIYYVKVARYINEQRGLFFGWVPEDFQNKTSMYTNPRRPKYFNWRSTQMCYSYIISFINGILFGALLFFFC